MKSYSEINAAPKGGIEVRIEGNIMRIFFDFERITYNVQEGEETITKKQFESECIDVFGGRKYNDIVSAIINDHYSNDDVQAIIANYTEAKEENTTSEELAPEKREEYIQEYNQFQEWRKKAKDVAKKVLDIIG